MAQQVETHEGSGESQFDEWLVENKLMKAKRKLIEHEVTMEELTELALNSNWDELNHYAKNTLGLNILEAKRFAKGVLALRPDESNIPSNSTQKTRILVSMEEKESMDRIDAKRKEIKSKLNESLKQITALRNVSQSSADEINKMRRDMTYQLNQRMDALLHISGQIIAKKTDEINAFIKELQSMDRALSNADSECNRLLDIHRMTSRKETILNVSDSVVSQQIRTRSFVATPITVQLNVNNFSEFIQRYGVITDPDIPKLDIKEKTLSSATILIGQNTGHDWKCSFQTRGNSVANDDEKKTNDEWENVNTIRNVDEYRLLWLQSATEYSVRARYERDCQYRAWSESIHFRTMADCFTVTDTAHFKYLYSEHGPCYHLFGYRLTRDDIKEHCWKIETSAPFRGRCGIIDDSENNITSELEHGMNLWDHANNISVGAGFDGTNFRSNGWGELSSFVRLQDILTIVLSFENNCISFESMKSKQKKTKPIKEKITAVRLIVEFRLQDSEISIL
eukprot:356897_1